MLAGWGSDAGFASFCFPFGERVSLVAKHSKVGSFVNNSDKCLARQREHTRVLKLKNRLAYPPGECLYSELLPWIFIPKGVSFLEVSDP